jgi:hypothetical protein
MEQADADAFAEHLAGGGIRVITPQLVAAVARRA